MERQKVYCSHCGKKLNKGICKKCGNTPAGKASSTVLSSGQYYFTDPTNPNVVYPMMASSEAQPSPVIGNAAWQNGGLKDSKKKKRVNGWYFIASLLTFAYVVILLRMDLLSLRDWDSYVYISIGAVLLLKAFLRWGIFNFILEDLFGYFALILLLYNWGAFPLLIKAKEYLLLGMLAATALGYATMSFIMLSPKRFYKLVGLSFVFTTVQLVLEFVNLFASGIVLTSYIVMQALGYAIVWLMMTCVGKGVHKEKKM